GDVLANIHSAISLFVDEPAPMGGAEPQSASGIGGGMMPERGIPCLFRGTAFGGHAPDGHIVMGGIRIVRNAVHVYETGVVGAIAESSAV
ncbi:hypothetical protein, partial [Bifidobacterium pullorum]|uniref:hypothetical protein n=1 Tax=Bifidobacterium pullorum TaxID=78448 RepID=UPI00242DFE45